jgi:flagellar protein FliS
MAGNRANQYRQTAITTASPGQVLIMLYEGAIQNVKRAHDCMEKKDIAGKGKYIGKAHDIINELSSTLNFEVGGDIAKDLEKLYNFIGSQLTLSNMNNTKEPLIHIIKLLDTLLSGWREAVQQVQKGQGK